VRILILHNRYRAAGGEERAVADLAAMLTRRGHEVRRLERSSADVTPARAARGMIGGGVDPRAVTQAVRDHRAEVVHAHNVHPLFGWRALAAARSAGAGVVLHLHNLRLFCAIGIAYRNGVPCYSCRGRNTAPGVAHRCRGSLAEAVTYATGLSLQHDRLVEHADRFVTVSQFTAGKLIDSGLPADRTDVLPNFIADEEIAMTTEAASGSYALAAGRLVEEKGFDTAITAARAAGTPLVVAGDGPDAERLRGLAAGADIRLPGRLDGPQLAELRRGAAFVLVPSRCDEACPYSATEALADGVPVIGSERGGLPELLREQRTAPAGDTGAWAAEMTRLWGDPAVRATLGQAALQTTRTLLSEQRYHDRLVAVYGEAQARVNRRPATGD
jgi:glycosyltransferase involved in cell wall biosynthesis